MSNSRINTILQMTPADWLDMLEAWGRLSFLNFRRPLLEVEELKVVETFQEGGRKASSEALDTARRLQKLVSIAARLQPFRNACLVRARCLQRMLANRGIASRLCIGVDKNPAGFTSHAWVEVNDQAIGEPQDITDRFKVLGPTQKTAN
jgi:hypothetical protein